MARSLRRALEPSARRQQGLGHFRGSRELSQGDLQDDRRWDKPPKSLRLRRSRELDVGPVVLSWGQRRALAIEVGTAAFLQVQVPADGPLSPE